MDCSVSGGFDWWIGKTLAEFAIVAGILVVIAIIGVAITISSHNRKVNK